MEAAERIQVTRRTMYSYLLDGRMPAIKVGGRWKISDQDIKKMLKKGPRRRSLATLRCIACRKRVRASHNLPALKVPGGPTKHKCPGCEEWSYFE